MLSKEEFSKLLIDRIRSEFPDTRIKDALPFGVSLASTAWGEIRLFFEKPYFHYCRSPERLDAILGAAIRDIHPLRKGRPETLEGARRHLLPALRSVDFLAESRRQLEGLSRELLPAARPLTGSVVVTYVVDRPEESTRTVVTQGDLAAWRFSVEELHRLAVENLAGMPGFRVSQASTESTGVLFAVEPADLYAASRLLLGVAADVARTTGEDLLIALPAPELLLLVPRSNRKGEDWVRTRVIPMKFNASPGRITERILIYRIASGTLEEE